MDKAHRDLILKNRVQLVADLKEIGIVLDYLLSKRVLTPGMKEEIMVQTLEHDKVRKLLDILPCRGQNAFQHFCEALEKDNPHLLDPFMTNSSSSSRDHVPSSRPNTCNIQPTDADTEELPDVWFDSNLCFAPVRVRPCYPDSPIVKMKWKKSSVYTMNKQNRGRVLIINNREFESSILPNRKGTENDVAKLKELFNQLNFTVDVQNQLKAEEIRKALDIERRHMVHNNANCFVFVILSHGTKYGVYGVDGHPDGRTFQEKNVVQLEEITTAFDGEHCPALVGKPKLFFIQACQGGSFDTGISVADGVDEKQTDEPSGLHPLDTPLEEWGQSMETLEESTGKLSLGEDRADTVMEKKVAAKSDILVACATTPGYVSFRNTEKGSWFIQAIVYVFQRYAHEDNILSMLTKVNKLVSKGRAKLEGKSKTALAVTRLESSLPIDFYFFPGMVDTEDAGS